MFQFLSLENHEKNIFLHLSNILGYLSDHSKAIKQYKALSQRYDCYLHMTQNMLLSQYVFYIQKHALNASCLFHFYFDLFDKVNSCPYDTFGASNNISLFIR